MMTLVLDFGFKKLKLNRIEYAVLVPNKGSIKLIESLGGKKEAKRREITRKRGRYIDDYLYSILRREWKK